MANEKTDDRPNAGSSVETSITAEEAVSEFDKLSRRDALAIIGKHTAYSAPALLLLLATHSKNVVAGSWG